MDNEGVEVVPRARRRDLFIRSLRIVLRYPRAFALAAVLIAAAGAQHGSDLPLRLSVVELLPENHPTVRDFQEVMAEVGGVGYLAVIIGPTDQPEAHLAPVLEHLRARPDVRYAFAEREAYVLDDHALYLLPRETFDQLLESADHLLFGGRTGGVLDLGLDTEAEREANLEAARAFFDRLKREHGLGETSERQRRYFLSRDGRYAMVFAKPTFDSEDLGRGTVLVEEVRAALPSLLPPEVPARLWGRYVNQVRDTLQIRRDIAITGSVGLAAILLLLVAGLGSVRSAVATSIAVLIAMGWTIGFVRIAVHQINVVTGFLLAILGGLGVEYGIHLVRRFQQERAAGFDRAEATERSYLEMGRALLSAALTSAGAFLILTTSTFRAFSELGAIAGFGVLATYLVYIACFPWASRHLPSQPRGKRLREAFGYYPFTLRSRWLLIPFLGAAAFGLHRARIDLSLDRLRELSEASVAENRFVAEIYGERSTTPAALAASSRAEAAAIRDRLRDPAFSSVIRDAVSLSSIVPEDQEERDEALRPERLRLAKVSDELLREKLGLDPARVRRWMAARPYTEADLPPQLRDPFGRNGTITLAYPAQHLGEIGPMRAFARVLLDIKAEHPEVKLGTDAIVLVEIADYVLNDGRLVLVLFLIGSFAVMTFDFRSAREAAGLEAQLCLGLFLLVALMGLFNQPFTILNIAMIPAVLAAGIDMGVHVRHRELEPTLGGRRRPSLESARLVAQAVHLGALTALVGFGSLFFAEVTMLRGIAWVACLGQLSMYLVSMIFWPVMKDRFLRPARAETVGASRAQNAP